MSVDREIEFAILITCVSLNNRFINSIQISCLVYPLSNLLAGYGRLGRYDEYLYVLKKIEKIKPSNQYEEAMRFHRLMVNRQVYFLNKGMIDEVCNLSSAIEKGIKNYKLNEGVQIVLVFNLIVAFFVNRKYKECIKWIRFYDSFKKMEIAKIKIQFAQILKTIAFYELGELDQLETHIRLTQKYFDTQLKLSQHNLDYIILRALKRIGNTPLNQQIKIIKELDVTLNELPIKTKRRVGFDEINLWIQSKIKNKTIIELLQERNKRKL